MDRLTHTRQNQVLRKQRVRAKINGTAQRPRLSVFISNRHLTAQLIDDTTHRTMIYATTIGQTKLSGSLRDRAVWLGEEIAKKATAAKIKAVVFDRNGRLYHGRLKALADAAREKGLEF